MIIQYRESDGVIVSSYYGYEGKIAVSTAPGFKAIEIPYNEDIALNPTAYLYVNGRIETARFLQFQLTARIEDTDSDGFLDLPADGSSQCRIDIYLKDANGDIVDVNEEFIISTDHGRLSQIQGVLESGFSSVMLTSSKETVRTKVVVVSKKFNIMAAETIIQFRP